MVTGLRTLYQLNMDRDNNNSWPRWNYSHRLPPEPWIICHNILKMMIIKLLPVVVQCMLILNCYNNLLCWLLSAEEEGEFSQLSDVRHLASIMSKSVLPQYSVVPLKTFPSGGSIFAYAANERKVSFKYPFYQVDHISSSLWQCFPLSVKLVQACKRLWGCMPLVIAQMAVSP